MEHNDVKYERDFGAQTPGKQDILNILMMLRSDLQDSGKDPSKRLPLFRNEERLSSCIKIKSAVFLM